MNMKMARAVFGTGSILGALTALGVLLHSTPASACGGFFCGQQPVDQTAERILFEVGQDSVTMTTQISFAGQAADFAWVLPLSEVPLADSLAVYHQQALNALDANSGPVFLPPNDPECYSCLGCEFALPAMASAVEEDGGSDVTVYIRQEVGDYDVAVIASEDPTALIEWLRAEGYRITAPMEPYIERYTSEGLKFLALKLVDTADVSDLRPFRFTLPGTAPTIPLRMTALAAEPEMSIVTFVLADTRFEGKNWPNVEIADNRIRYNPFAYYATSVSTNWAQLVAKSVDEEGGQGWVTEFAGPSASYAEQVRAQVQNGNFGTEDDAAAAAELLGALDAHPYLTRLYTRLSAEEMTSDPVLGRSALGNVDRQHQLSRVVEGIDQCSEEARESTDPCDFATCGAGGLCRPVSAPGVAFDSSVANVSAGCACVPGATARATFAPDGSPTVICQDGRMSFLNAGDRETADAAVLPDACAGYDCGEHGQCTAMNMTPTCVCDQGFVATGSIDDSGVRRVTCSEPDEAVPAAFYEKRLAPLPVDLPGGRDVGVAEVLPPVSTPPMGTPTVPTEMAPTAGFPMPRGNPDYPPTPSTSGGDGSGGCHLGTRSGAGGATSSAAAIGLAALLIATTRARRRAG